MSNKHNYFISLVGKNPLPVYISSLQHVDEFTKVYLIYSEEEENSVSTKTVATNIEKALKDKKGNIHVSLIEGSKSDVRKLIGLLNKIVEEVNAEAIKNADSCITKVKIDYTGGTKIMAASVYNYFQEIHSKYEYIDFTSIYVSNGHKVIYETAFKDNRRISHYGINNIAEKYEVTSQDVVNLHGYNYVEESGEIIIEDFQGRKKEVKIDTIEIDGFTLSLGIKVNSKDYKENKVKKQDLTHKFFLINDIGEKIGGTECHLKFYVDSEKILELEEKFHKSIKSISNIDIKNKVELILKEED